MKPRVELRNASHRTPVARGVLLAECVAWVGGFAALAICAAVSLAGVAGARQDVDRFAALRADGAASFPESSTPDVSLWGASRVQAWRAALGQPAPAPLAVLRIPKARLRVAVLPGTNDFILNRGVGHIEDTAVPGAAGNAGIAGHRDGFFRALKDIAHGDAIELETLEGLQLYRVEQTWIVKPEDVWVLDETPVQALTLVTCYPFYFVGSAPERFIVRAVRADMRHSAPRSQG